MTVSAVSSAPAFLPLDPAEQAIVETERSDVLDAPALAVAVVPAELTITMLGDADTHGGALLVVRQYGHAVALIELGDDAVGQVIESYVGAGWSNRATTVRLGRAARLQRAVRLLQAGGFVSLRDEATIGAGAPSSQPFPAAEAMAVSEPAASAASIGARFLATRARLRQSGTPRATVAGPSRKWTNCAPSK